MGHDTIPAEECVGISDEKATGMSTEVSVSKKSSKASSKSGYHISNNFK